MFYPDELVEEVRERNDIVDVISSYVNLQKKGSNFTGLCPFHNEKTASFVVSPGKQMYHCFGCGVGGNVFTFVMEYENYTFVEALKMLAERANVVLPERESTTEEKRQADLKASLLELNKIAAKYYYVQLRSERGKVAYDYLKNRQLSDETMKQFGLGYATKFSGELYQYMKQQGYADELLKQSGLFTIDEEKGGHDKFWNRVMFPIMDGNNRVIAFGGRVMGDGLPKYLNSPETKLFDKSRNLYGLNFARLSRKSYFLICEGYMDVIALHQAGFTNAVASLGTAFTGLQANLLKRYTNEVLLTYDSDGAGIHAALRAIPILKEAGITTKVIHMDPYKDPDEFIKALGAEAFEERIANAENSFLFEISALQRDYDLEDPESKTKFFNEVAKKLLQFEEELERNNYIEAIARKYFVGYENLRKLVNKMGASYIPPSREETQRPVEVRKTREVAKEDGIKQSQRILLTWLIEEPELYDKVTRVISKEDFVDSLYHEVAALLFEQYEQEHRMNPAKIINRFESKEEQNEVASLFSTVLGGQMSKEEKEKALNETVIKIKKYSLEYASKQAIESNDIQAFQRIIAEQANLQKLHISL